MKKLVKNKCEIEGCKIIECLHLHHIIPRTDLNTTNHSDNLAILCPTHHAYVHCNRLIIIGIFPSTRLPNGRTLIYELDGKRNIEGIDEPLVQFKPKSFKIFMEEEE